MYKLIMLAMLSVGLLGCGLGGDCECTDDQCTCDCPEGGDCECDPYEVLNDSQAFFGEYYLGCLGYEEEAREWVNECELPSIGNRLNCTRWWWYNGVPAITCHELRLEIQNMRQQGDCTEIRLDPTGEVYRSECPPMEPWW